MAESRNSGMNVDKTSFVFGLVAGIALMAVIMLASSSFGSGKAAGDFKQNTYGTPSAAAQPSAQPGAASAVKPITADDHLRGNVNASIDIIEYSDFQCPYCLRHEDTINQLLADYGDKIRFAYRHFPLTSIHPEAQKAAEASECAAEQGKFWEMHDKIFQANAADSMSVDVWKQDAKDLGLKTTQFNDCLDSGKYADKVSQEEQEGQAAGVQGTPATFINGQMISGAVPYSNIKSVIDGLLQQK